MTLRSLGGLALVTVTALVTACASSHDATDAHEGAAAASGPLAVSFAGAAAAHAVPRDLLVAIAQTEGALDIPRLRDVDPDNEVPAAGPMQLRRGKLDTLARGATLSGHSELELRRDADLALDAGAAVLAEVGARTGAHDGDLASWSDAVAEMGGYADDAHRAHYVHRVFALLARGGTFVGRDGESITLPSHDEIPPTLTFDVDPQLHAQATAQFPGAEWFPTSCVNKCDTTRNGYSVTRIAIHDTEGGWDASVSTLQNDPSKSVHYIVGTDGKIGQFVPESYTAWHVGNYYYNETMVGIEHVGYANKPYTEAQYAASAKLVTYLIGKYHVPADRAHVIGHDQVPDGNVLGEQAAPCSASPQTCETGSSYGGADNHRDPGDWEWATYMPRIGGSAKCNDVTSLLNCSYDKTQAFRCTNGKVEVLTCNGPNKCQTQANGVDDLCDQAAPVPPPPTDDGGAAPAPVASDGGAAPRPPGEFDPAPPSDSSGGCSVGVGSVGTGELSEQEAFAGVALAFGLAVASRRRRRRRGTQRAAE